MNSKTFYFPEILDYKWCYIPGHGNDGWLLWVCSLYAGGLLSPHLGSEEGLSPTVELDTRSLEAVLHLHKEGSKSRSPSCEPWQTGLRSQSCELLQTEPGLGSCEYSSRSRSCQSLQTNSTQDAAQSANINTDSGTPPSVTQPPEPILGELTVNWEGPPSESDTGSEQVETVTAEFVWSVVWFLLLVWLVQWQWIVNASILHSHVRLQWLI